MRITHTARLPLLAATVLAASLGLTGCFANPVETIIDRTLEENGVDIDQDGDDVTWDTDDGTVTAGDDLELPASFPSDLPVPDGKLTAVVDMDNGSFTTQWEEITHDEVVRLAAGLVDGGYTMTSELNTADAYSGAFELDGRLVTLLWTDGDVSGGALVYGLTEAG